MTPAQLIVEVQACNECHIKYRELCPRHEAMRKELEARAAATAPPNSAPLDLHDPRQQRALALRRLAFALNELDCAHGYMRNSDPGSSVLDDVQKVKDQVAGLQVTLQFRQRRENTP